MKSGKDILDQLLLTNKITKKMKKVFSIALMSCLTLFCVGQQSQSKVDFLKFVNPQYTNIMDCSLSPKGDTTIAYVYYEIGVKNSKKNGKSCLFAIPKKNFTIWNIDYRINWKREDIQKNQVNKLNIARDYLFKKSSRSVLLDNFDLYVFHVRQNDLFIAFQEINDDGKMIDAYDIKEGALIYTYKYENSTWIEKKKESIDNGIPRTYGNGVVRKILRERFGKTIVQ
jgi:hypothetical protein